MSAIFGKSRQAACVVSPLLCATLAGTVAAASQQQPLTSEPFDRFADQPRAATAEQYFEGAEQDALDRDMKAVDSACRCCPKTSPHTRQQAIDFGISPAEAERYVVMPGQACAYKIGLMQILAERAQERAALGSRFSLRRFHDLLLRTGTVPLAVLAQVVDADIAQAREGRTP